MTLKHDMVNIDRGLMEMPAGERCQYIILYSNEVVHGTYPGPGKHIRHKRLSTLCHGSIGVLQILKSCGPTLYSFLGYMNLCCTI